MHLSLSRTGDTAIVVGRATENDPEHIRLPHHAIC